MKLAEDRLIKGLVIQEKLKLGKLNVNYLKASGLQFRGFFLEIVTKGVCYEKSFFISFNTY